MHRKLISILTAVAVTMGISVHAAADTAPEDAFDYRAAIMTTFRGHLVAASMTMRGLVNDNGQIVNHARGIANSTRELGGIFQKGSNVGDSEALPVVFDLLKLEGLCLGSSSGINVAGAIRMARDMGPGHTIVTILADGGQRYQSKLFNPEFLKQKDLPVPDWL